MSTCFGSLMSHVVYLCMLFRQDLFVRECVRIASIELFGVAIPMNFRKGLKTTGDALFNMLASCKMQMLRIDRSRPSFQRSHLIKTLLNLRLGRINTNTCERTRTR